MTSILVLVTILTITVGPYLTLLVEDIWLARHGKFDLGPPRVDYARINAIERDLGLRQTDYSEFGVKPIDTAQVCIEENAKVLRNLEIAFMSPSDRIALIEQRIAAIYSVPPHVLR